MRSSWLLVVGTLAGVVTLATAHSCGARAQSVPSHVAARIAMGSSSRASFAGQDMSPPVVLARVVVKEAGFDGLSDLAPIADVLARVGRGDVVRGARLYSPRAFFPETLGRRPYVAYLHADGSLPRGWPSSMAWERFRARWLTLVGAARAHLSSAAKGCPEQPQHWGAARGVDHERAMRAGWVRLDCGRTANAFWRVPR